MTAIELRFPTGKWHATPWGRQVNEGAVEWPPAPWRLLRALLAVWHHKFPDVAEADMRRLIEALTPTPVYRVPVCSRGHTRHFMPAANDAKTKIFDTFVAVSPDDALVICWPDLQLDDELRALLSRLLNAMSYFGRAESWVIAQLSEGFSGEWNARPLNGSGVGHNQELVRLLSPTSGSDYASWRTGAIEDLKDRKLAEKRQKAEQKGKPPEKEKLTPKDVRSLEAVIPEDLFDALHAETNELRAAGWNRPPGSQWVDYVCEKQVGSLPTKRSSRPRRRPTVARFALVGAVRPRLTETLSLTEVLRRPLMGASKAASPSDTSSPVFSGKSAEGSPRQHGHFHLHILPEQPESSRCITHLTLFAPAIQHDDGKWAGGFAEDDVRALQRLPFHPGTLKQLRWNGHELQLVLLGLGRPEDFGGCEEAKGQSPLLAENNIWISRTPFVPADRLRRRYQLDDSQELHRLSLDLARIVRAEFRRRPWLAHHAAQLKDVDVVFDRRPPGTTLGGTHTSWLKFRRERQRGGGRRGDAYGYGLRLTFGEPVQGPIVIGYGCHFGLGQFIPAECSR